MIKERIAYIDFMKGLCITLLAVGHCGGNLFNCLLPNLDIALQSLMVPLFFFISGIFFNPGKDFSNFTRKKINNLIVTLLFFHFLCSFIKFPLAIIIQNIRPDINIKFGIFDVIPPFWGRFWKAAGALWFLVALFLMNLLYYLFQKYLNRMGVYTAVLLCAVLGYILMRNKIQLPFEADIALVGLPYFFIGSIMKQKNLLAPSKYDKWGYLVFMPCVLYIYYFSESINFLYQGVPNFFKLYFNSFVAILSLFWVCRNLPYVPLVCYYGRYSLIILGTHQLLALFIYFLIRSFSSIQGNTLYLIIFLAVMVLEIFIIKFMIKYFPKFTAQEDFFKPGWKI